MDRVVSDKQQLMTKSSGVRNTLAYRLTLPGVRILARTSITPSAITWFGFLLSVGAMALIITGHLLVAGIIVLVAGFFDMLDGALARHTNQATRFGAVLDSILDRFSEAVVLFGILVFFAANQSFTGILLVGVALLGSLLTSYIRAKAEALGLECEVGIFTRPERVLVLALGLLLMSQIDYALVAALAIIVLLSFITVGQRLVKVWQQTRAK